MVKWTLQNTNPTAMPGCSSGECPACKWGRGEGGPCRKSNTLYEFACQQCPSGNRAVYLGETARNLYTRGREHANNYTRGENESFMKKHQTTSHAGVPATFKARVVESYKDCLTRQIAEGVYIRRSNNEVLNSKSEWHQPALWKVRCELSRE